MQQRPYQKLIAWQEAHALCKWVYKTTAKFPSEERFGLTSQMRRCGYGIPMNLAEGNGRRSLKEKVHFINISQGSLEELHYQCFLGYELQYISEEQILEVDPLIQRVGFLLGRLRKSLL